MKRPVVALVLCVGLAAASCNETSVAPATSATPTPTTASGTAQPPSPSLSHDPSPGAQVRVDYHPKVSVKTYVVHGTSANAIFDEIRKRGPGPWAGEAAWQISYDTVGDYSDTSGRCRLQRVIVHTDITLTLPRWDPTGSPDPGARSYWQSTSATLERHERGHQRLVEQASQRLVRELSRIRSALSCGQLYDRGDHVANRVFSDLNRANRRYDAITDHGLNQSAAA